MSSKTTGKGTLKINEEAIDHVRAVFNASSGEILDGLMALEALCDELGIEVGNKSLGQLEREIAERSS